MPKTAEHIIDLRKIYQPSPKQQMAHDQVAQYILYGGAVGGGKSVWLCNEAIQLSLEYPRNVGYLCRHELTSFRRTTQLTLERYLLDSLITQHHQTEAFYRLRNGSLIFYGGLGDDQRAIDRLKSMELGWFGIDQAEETSESHFYLLASRLRLKIPDIKYRGLMTANPAPGWVKHRFIEQQKADHIFIPSLPKDNPYLPGDYESKLRELYPEDLVKQLLDGDWDALESGNYLFRYADIKAAIERAFYQDSETIFEKVPRLVSMLSGVAIDPREEDRFKNEPCIMGVDIARFGDDSSVVIVRQGKKVIWIQRWAKTDLMDTTGRIVNLIDRFNPAMVNLDIIGLGSGVYDRLVELKYKPTGVNGAEPGKDKDKFANIRAEIYKGLSGLFEAGDISIPDDLELVAQLSGIKYKFNSRGQMQIESKEDMKKRGMKSPDKADALSLAFMESKRSEPSVRWL